MTNLWLAIWHPVQAALIVAAILGFGLAVFVLILIGYLAWTERGSKPAPRHEITRPPVAEPWCPFSPDDIAWLSSNGVGLGVESP